VLCCTAAVAAVAVAAFAPPTSAKTTDATDGRFNFAASCVVAVFDVVTCFDFA